MARKFDSGLDGPIRTKLRTAVAAELWRALGRRPGNSYGFLLASEKMPRLITSEDDMEGIDIVYQTMKGRSPSCAVALGKLEGEQTGMGGNSQSGDIEIEVYWLSQNNRGIVDGRLETDPVGALSLLEDPGIDAMLECGRMFLQNFDPQLVAPPDMRQPSKSTRKRTGRLRFVKEWQVATDQDWSMWAQRYKTNVTLDVDPTRDLATIFGPLDVTIRVIDAANVPANPVIISEVVEFESATLPAPTPISL